MSEQNSPGFGLLVVVQFLELGRNRCPVRLIQTMKLNKIQIGVVVASGIVFVVIVLGNAKQKWVFLPLFIFWIGMYLARDKKPPN
jgi:hypothetical protein